jgi:hypothetical protein
MVMPSKYRERYCADVIKHCSTGASLTSFAASVNVCRATVGFWGRDHPEFHAAVQIAKTKCAAWWEVVNRKIASEGGGTGSAQACSLGLKNMAPEDWREKHEHEITGPHGGAIQHDFTALSSSALRELAKLGISE